MTIYTFVLPSGAIFDFEFKPGTPFRSVKLVLISKKKVGGPLQTIKFIANHQYSEDQCKLDILTHPETQFIYIEHAQNSYVIQIRFIKENLKPFSALFARNETIYDVKKYIAETHFLEETNGNPDDINLWKGDISFSNDMTIEELNIQKHDCLIVSVLNNNLINQELDDFHIKEEINVNQHSKQNPKKPKSGLQALKKGKNVDSSLNPKSSIKNKIISNEMMHCQQIRASFPDTTSQHQNSDNFGQEPVMLNENRQQYRINKPKGKIPKEPKLRFLLKPTDKTRIPSKRPGKNGKPNNGSNSSCSNRSINSSQSNGSIQLHPNQKQQILKDKNRKLITPKIDNTSVKQKSMSKSQRLPDTKNIVHELHLDDDQMPENFEEEEDFPEEVEREQENSPNEIDQNNQQSETGQSQENPQNDIDQYQNSQQNEFDDSQQIENDDKETIENTFNLHDDEEEAEEENDDEPNESDEEQGAGKRFLGLKFSLPFQLPDGSTQNFPVAGNETIGDIKTRFSSLLNCSPDCITLNLKGKDLNDEKVQIMDISEYHGSTPISIIVHVNETKPGEGKTEYLFRITGDNYDDEEEKLKLFFDSEATIKDAKTAVANELHKKVDQLTMIYNCKNLTDAILLRKLRIPENDGSIIVLVEDGDEVIRLSTPLTVMKPRKPFEIIFLFADSKKQKIVLNVPPLNSVDDVKEQVANEMTNRSTNDEVFTPDQLDFIFGGKMLSGDLIFDGIGVHNGSKIVVNTIRPTTAKLSRSLKLSSTFRPTTNGFLIAENSTEDISNDDDDIDRWEDELFNEITAKELLKLQSLPPKNMPDAQKVIIYFRCNRDMKCTREALKLKKW